MGSSCWVYYVPYQENIEQAFQELRQHLFETGDDFDDYVPPPQTIREGLERSEGSGTHTAMDIEWLSAEPRDYHAVPLPAEILHRFFTETTPSRRLVESLVVFAEGRVFHPPQQPWLREQIDWESFSFRHRGLSEETRRFVERSPSKQGLIEVLLTQENIWRDFHRILRTEIGSIAINETRRMGDMMPFSSEELVSFFGTEKPTRAAFESVLDEFWDHLTRWTGFYTVLYQDGVSHEIAFVGVSGD